MVGGLGPSGVAAPLNQATPLPDCIHGFLLDKRFLILDRDTKFTTAFKRTLRDAGVDIVTTCYQAPSMNAFAERFVRSIKSECLDRMILVGERSLHRALAEFVAHYHDWSHQGLDNEPIRGSVSTGDGDVVVSERLGGLLKHYRRAAA